MSFGKLFVLEIIRNDFGFKTFVFLDKYMIFLQENLRIFFLRVSKNGFSCQYNKLFFKQEFLVLKNVFWGTSLKIFLWAENISF